MNFGGFTAQDFQVFTIKGLDERMAAIKTYIRPKLELLGTQLAPTLSTMLNEEIYPHVAKHARRSVNPPDDTWVAWANNKRGYKKHPHFQVGLWQTHLFIWFALIYEAPQKIDFAQHALAEMTAIYESIPSHFVWSVDHTKPDVVAHQDLSIADLRGMLERLEKVKKAELLCGLTFNNDHPLLLDGPALQNKIEETFKTLLPLYHLAQPR